MKGRSMKQRLIVIALAAIAGCASTGIVPTGQDTYMVAKKSAAGVATSGSTIKAEIYVEASEYCARTGLVVETITVTSANAIPFARMPQAELNFRCVPRGDPPARAASSP